MIGFVAFLVAAAVAAGLLAWVYVLRDALRHARADAAQARAALVEERTRRHQSREAP